MAPLLEVRDLKTTFRTDDGVVGAVDGVSFSVEKGKTLAIVGESGCGKSVTCMSIMGLYPSRNATITGEAIFKDRDLLKLDPDELRRVRGNEISMIFQDPMTSLNPVHTVGRQLSEAVWLHHKVSKARAKAQAAEMLKAVGIPRGETRVDDYPHQFSGGMRQRVMIAMALINNPDLLIADEPTTALDVTTQAQILSLMNRLQTDFGSAIILVTHDLGVVAETADDVLVMYAARPAEEGGYEDIFYRPRHPVHVGPSELAAAPRRPRTRSSRPSAAARRHCCARPPAAASTSAATSSWTSAARSSRRSSGHRGASHRDACFLDSETKDRESAPLVTRIKEAR